MALNTFTGATNANYGTATNWSLGAVPTASDGNVATFDNTSPNCTVNVAAVANAIDFSAGTGYTGTVTMTSSFTISGNVTLGAAMVIAGAGGITVNTTSTLTANGITWPNAFNLAGASQTFTLADNWIVGGQFNPGAGSGTTTVNGNQITCNFNYANSGAIVTGTTLFILGGTGAFSSTGATRNNLTINTAGTITCGASITYNTGTLTYTAGTVVTTGNTLSIGASTTLNTSGMTWNAITFSGTQTITLSSDLNSSGLISISGTTATVTINGAYNFNVAGGISFPGTAEYFAGSATIVMTGTGTIQATTNFNCGFQINLTINTAGTITFGTAQQINFGNAKTFTYTAGTVNFATGTLGILVSSSTFNINGISPYNITATSGATLTLSSNLNITNIFNPLGLLTMAGTGVWTTKNFTATVAGSAITLVAGQRYTILSTGTLTMTGTNASHVSFISSGAAVAYLDLQYGATQDLSFCNATYIDSTGGQLIRTFKGTIDANSLNWILLTPPGTVATGN